MKKLTAGRVHGVFILGVGKINRLKKEEGKNFVFVQRANLANLWVHKLLTHGEQTGGAGQAASAGEGGGKRKVLRMKWKSVWCVCSSPSRWVRNGEELFGSLAKLHDLGLCACACYVQVYYFCEEKIQLLLFFFSEPDMLPFAWDQKSCPSPRLPRICVGIRFKKITSRRQQQQQQQQQQQKPKKKKKKKG